MLLQIVDLVVEISMRSRFFPEFSGIFADFLSAISVAHLGGTAGSTAD